MSFRQIRLYEYRLHGSYIFKFFKRGMIIGMSIKTQNEALDFINRNRGFDDLYDEDYPDLPDMYTESSDRDPTPEELAALEKNESKINPFSAKQNNKPESFKVIARRYLDKALDSSISEEERIENFEEFRHKYSYSMHYAQYRIRKETNFDLYDIADPNQVCKCSICGREHSSTDMILKEEDTQSTTDLQLYCLIGRYDLSGKCSCGQYFAANCNEEVVAKWLTNNTMWKQYTFEDCFPTNELFGPSTPVETPNVEVVSIDLSGQENEDLEKLSELNEEIAIFCKDTFSVYENNNNTYFEEVKSLKTAVITTVAKEYAVLNFARMNNIEKKVSVALLKCIIATLPVNLSDELKNKITEIIARNTSAESEKELMGLSILSAEEVKVLVSLPEKVLYDKLQTLIKQKMILSKNCIWGKVK